MKRSSTLFYVIDDYNDLNFLAEAADLFDIDSRLSDCLSLFFKEFELSPPDSLVNKILVND